MRVALAALHDAPLEILRLFSAQVNNLLSSFKFMLQHSSYMIYMIASYESPS